MGLKNRPGRLRINNPTGLLAIFLVGAFLAGCGPRDHYGRQPLSLSLRDAFPITLDGQITPGEWPGGIIARADHDNFYFRVPGAEQPLQAGFATTTIWVDEDRDSATGVNPPGLPNFGADLIVHFSPPDPQKPNGVGSGARVERISPDGETELQTPARAGLLPLPTNAAAEHEVRVARTNPGADSPARALITRTSSNEHTAGGGPTIVDIVPDRRRHPNPPRAAIIEKHARADVRIVSCNVLWASPLNNPAPFERIFAALAPDIILLQEWDLRDFDAPKITAHELATWFNDHLPALGPWHAAVSTARGVAIVARHPLEDVGLAPLSPTIEANGEELMRRNVRLASAIVHTPSGDILAGSLHLKCCGAVGTSEDLKRIAESLAINTALRHKARDIKPAALVLAGDVNLVGSQLPLELLRTGADLDGSNLTVAQPTITGDRAVYTWRDPKSNFPPGRLDYLLYSDHTASAQAAFILDCGALSDRDLRDLNLLRTDTSASDHLPTVIDLRIHR